MNRYPYTVGLLSVIGTLIAFLLMVCGPGFTFAPVRYTVAWLILLASMPGWLIPLADLIDSKLHGYWHDTTTHPSPKEHQ